MIKLGIDRYDVEARYVPALVTSVPFLFFGHYFIGGLDGVFWQSALGIKIGSLGLPAALYLVTVHFCRTIGKVLEENWFRNGLAFPTTEFLIDTDTSLTQNRKMEIRRKIKKYFKIDLSDTHKDTDANRRLIHEAVGQIRNVFYKKNHLIQQRNIQYGLTRNLLAGSIIAAFVSASGLLVSNLLGNNTASTIALTLLVMYILLAIISVVLVNFTARQYAHTLYNEFMAL